MSVWDKYNPKKIWKQPDPQVLCKVYIPKGDSHAARLMNPFIRRSRAIAKALIYSDTYITWVT